MTAITATIPENIVKALGPVTPNTLLKAEAVWEHLHGKDLQPSYLWGYGPNPEHNNRRCLDVMCYRHDGTSGIDRRVGDETVRFLWDNAALFGVKHLIWRQRIISTQTQAGVWRAMATRANGDPTANHYDHVHVNFGSDTFGWTGSGGSTAPSTTPKPSGKLSVDGKPGPNYVRRKQQWLGTTPDGVVSGQTHWIIDHNPGLKARGLDVWALGGHGSDMIRADQRRLAKKRLYKGAIDGLAGPKYWTALQRELGTTADGVVSDPSNVIRADQRRLNK